MSVYVTGGTTGVALGPIIGAVLFTLFGIHGTAPANGSNGSCDGGFAGGGGGSCQGGGAANSAPL